MANLEPSVVVVGAGIIGACTAYYLARKGARVTLLDRGGENATVSSFGWINAHSPQHQHYFQMRMKSMDCWQELSQAYPQLPILFGGGLDWDIDEGNLQSVFARYCELGYDCELVSGDKLAELVPSISLLPAQAIHCKQESAVDPEGIVQAFVALAKEHGVQFQPHSRINAIHSFDARVTGVQTSSGNIDCDKLVICAGAGSAALLAKLDIMLPMIDSYGVLMRTSAIDIGTNMVFSTPGLYFRQLANGSLLVGGDQAGGELDRDNEEASDKLLNKLKKMMPHAENTKVAANIRGLRPIPADNKPVVGLIGDFENLYAAVTHSGITMAPLIGEKLAEQIVDGVDCEDMAPFSIARFETMPNPEPQNVTGKQ